MAYENYTVRQFRDCWFKGDYSVIKDKDEFNVVYGEYMDASGLFLSDDFEKQGLIYNINQRINYIKLFIRLQRDFIAIFGFPFERDFKNLKHKYGYVLKWKNNLLDFENQLRRVEDRELKQSSFLEGKIKELNDMRKNKGVVKEEDEDTLNESRRSFIRMYNSLGKVGFKVDVDSTTVEELALMIKQQLEDAEDSRRQHGR